MGAFTSIRKRGEETVVPFPHLIEQSDDHIAKKLKLSESMSQKTADRAQPSLCNSVVSRLSLYPSTKNLRIPREVHAPVRNLNSRRSFANNPETTHIYSRRSILDAMGKFNFFNKTWANSMYQRTKKSAMKSLRHVLPAKQMEKEVIQIGSEDENRDDTIDDSSTEEFEILNYVENIRQLNAKKGKKEDQSLDSSAVSDSSDVIAKVDAGKKTRLSLKSDDSGEPIYKKLLKNSEKSNSTIASLHYNIEVESNRLEAYRISPRSRKKLQLKKDVTKECFLPLTEDDEILVSRGLANANRRKIVVSHESSNIDITGEKLQCLKPGAWLNDEVINLYLELLKEREKRENDEPKKFLTCHFFNTFFYKKLVSGGYNYSSVRRWTTQRKLGYSLFECDKIFVPIHRGNHWCLAVINKMDEKFQYLDSLGGTDNRVLDALARYFVDEVKDKCGKAIDVNSWEHEFVTDLPEQENGYDCGMFMIKYTDFYSRGFGLCFRQEHMPYFRQRTAKEILKLRAD